MVSFDASTAGTSARAWSAEARMHDRPRLDLAAVEHLLVIAPHPDDETLGAGGLIAECVRRGIPATVVLVTDGGAAGLADRRAREFATATATLGALTVTLGFPDGAADTHRDEIARALSEVVGATPPTTLVASPWRGDGHRDHRVVGEVVAGVVGGRPLVEYPVWLWHWGDPASEDVPWERLRSLPVDADLKRRALSAYVSQTEGDDPVLRADFVENFERDLEYFIVPETGSGLSREYFESTHRRHADPWGFETRWYEERKRAVTLASLPHRAYATALEVGCSIGVLTEALSARVEDLLAVDVSQAAVDRARERVGGAARIERADALTEFPAGRFELVVLSEVGYYFDRAGLERVLDSVEAALADDGTLVACHWRHPVDDYPLRGDDVHDAIRRRALTTTVLHTEDDFVLEVFSRDGRSVARRAGLA